MAEMRFVRGIRLQDTKGSGHKRNEDIREELGIMYTNKTIKCVRRSG